MSSEGKRWTIYVCDKGHVDHSTLNGVCWQCFPGGRRTWEPGRPKETKPNQERIEVVPASEVERLRKFARWTMDTRDAEGIPASYEDIYDRACAVLSDD